MNPKLKALLAAIGIVVIGGVASTLFIPRLDTTAYDLADAGIGDCLLRERSCLNYGASCPDGGGYCQTKMAVFVCPEPDAGPDIIVPRKFLRLAELDDTVWCGPVTTTSLQAGADTPDVFRCACRMDAGLCVIDNPDGGATPIGAPRGRTLKPGEWGVAGPGCLRKPCVELAGHSSWPPECPLH